MLANVISLLILQVIPFIYAGVSDHPAWKILNAQECGESVADRIIGGTNAGLGQFPWIARLGYITDDADDLEWLCGGSLISSQFVLTAAHCVKSEYELKKVRLGEYDIRQDPDCLLGVCAPGVQDRNVSRTVVHPSFTDFHYDIAVLEMDKPVTLNDYVATICLPREKIIGNSLKIGELLTVAGWGKTNMTTDERALVLQVVQIPVVTSEMCNELSKTIKVNDGEICAGAQVNKDACGGDSGGPLMKVFDTAEGPKTQIVGIVSLGPTHCGIRKPGVYTSVEHYLDWILDSIV